MHLFRYAYLSLYILVVYIHLKSCTKKLLHSFHIYVYVYTCLKKIVITSFVNGMIGIWKLIWSPKNPHFLLKVLPHAIQHLLYLYDGENIVMYNMVVSLIIINSKCGYLHYWRRIICRKFIIKCTLHTHTYTYILHTHKEWRL